MFGKATPDVIDKLGVTVDFVSAANEIVGLFATTAPALGPCLGLLGFGFGLLDKLNSVSPEEIIKEVNKAIEQVVENTNRRFEVMQEYVERQVREAMQEAMEDDYKGQFETWNQCLQLPTKARVDNCQEVLARVVNGLKYRFMFQRKYSENEEMSRAGVKSLELQLPVLKKWADFHLLVIAALMNTFKEDNRAMYRLYRGNFINNGNLYIGYMEWGLNKIRQSRIEDNSKSPSLDCKDFNDQTKFHALAMPMFATLKSSSRRCSFKCDSMRPDYCDIVTTIDCSSDLDCIFCSGYQCSSKAGLNVFHNILKRQQQKNSDIICETYIKRLEKDLNAFWTREVEVFLPIFKDIIKKISEELVGEEKKKNKKGKKDIIDDGSGQETLSNPKKMNDDKKDIFRQDEENILKRTSGGQSLKDYLDTVKKNSEIFKEKMQEKKIFKKKNPAHR